MVEKIGERRRYFMNTVLTDRLCYGSAMTWTYAYVAAVEELIDAFECVYHLSNIDNATMVELHLLVDHDKPQVPSLAMVWEGLDWHEREAFDMMGVEFEGHPNLKRILLPLDWEGHPLRKDYIYPIKEEEW